MESPRAVHALKEWLRRVQELRERYALAETVGVFGAGFLFDIATLSRADDVVTLVQQGAYLLLLCLLLALDQRHKLKGDLPRPLARGMEFAEAGIHFFLGALLSTFTLSYFKSGSGFTSLLFVLVVFALLLANELPGFRRHGPVVRFALLSFCLLSYFASVIPVIFGRVRPWMFVTATVLSVAAMGGIFALLNRWSPEKRPLLRRSVLPGLSVQAVLLALYFLKVIPPVPLALTYIGIYHYVEQPMRPVPGAGAARTERFVTDGRYRLVHERPWWRFWHHGDQIFQARDGDQVFCFLSIFAPNKFRDQVRIIWSRWDERQGQWLIRDSAPMPLGRGGATRDAGWRTFRSKTRYEPGEWRAEAQTDDGRTIGSIRFTILKDTRQEPRQLAVDLR